MSNIDDFLHHFHWNVRWKSSFSSHYLRVITANTWNSKFRWHSPPQLLKLGVLSLQKQLFSSECFSSFQKWERATNTHSHITHLFRQINNMHSLNHAWMLRLHSGQISQEWGNILLDLWTLQPLTLNYIPTHTYIQTRTHTHTHTHVHTNTYTHTQTHIHVDNHYVYIVSSHYYNPQLLMIFIVIRGLGNVNIHHV